MSDLRNSQSPRAREAQRQQRRSTFAPHWRRLRAEYLTPQEATVLGLRLGIVNNQATPHKTIARRLNVSEKSVVEIERHALAKCRRVLTTEGLL